MEDLMKHARQFQDKLAQVQEELAARMVTGT
ncbi:MAG TPA: YbaB/EbfC family nucleoid-associated protein, partial [Desulfobacteraceae bacterium]|nr:YbaB/EbfC family nucleoid-associated protein [Desulfobacteraceae bacterium]